MKNYKNQQINRYIGYVFLVIYIIMAVALMIQVADLGMFPLLYLAIIVVIFMILGVLFFLMHRKLATSIIASILSLVMIFLCGAGAYYIRRTTDALADVTTMGEQTDVVSVYVMNDDAAQEMEDIKDYNIGVVGMASGEGSDEMVTARQQ